MANQLLSETSITYGEDARPLSRPGVNVMLYSAECPEGQVFTDATAAQRALDNGWSDEPEWPVVPDTAHDPKVLSDVLRDIEARVSAAEDRLAKLERIEETVRKLGGRVSALTAKK